MGDLYELLDSDMFEEHKRKSQEAWEEICSMEEPLRDRLREKAGQEINLEKCDFLGKKMCEFLLKQRMIDILKDSPVPKI